MDVVVYTSCAIHEMYLLMPYGPQVECVDGLQAMSEYSDSIRKFNVLRA